MSERVKTNEEIRAHPDEAREVIARARAAFAKIEGVVSVGFGQKQTGGEYHDRIAITVVVREKKPLDELAPEERIPPVFEGYPTDVIVVKQSRATLCDNDLEYEIIRGGIQVAPQIRSGTGTGPGTLACIVRKRGDRSRENVYLLSCQHVLFSTGAGVGDYVYHPYPPPAPGFAPFGPSRTLGPIQAGFHENRGYTPPGTSTPVQAFIDCAFARIDIDSKCWGSTCTKDVIRYETSIIDLSVGSEEPVTDVRDVYDDVTIIGQKVFKVGRTTGRTVGIVRHTADSTLLSSREHPDDAVLAVNIISIDFDTASTSSGENCKGRASFSEPGDSGSLVVDESHRAIGLLMSSEPDVSPASSSACHIVAVLDNLQVCIPVTGGTSHGSCAATDGSGLELVAATADLPTDGGFRFTTGALGTRVRIPEPAPITDAERDRMLVLRDELRETALGRELHETFAEVRREIGYLVRNVRPVTLAWHRHNGPAFLAHVLNHLKGDAAVVPHEIGGVTREALLTRMVEVLTAHGSNRLRDAIVRFQPVLRPLFVRCDTVRECLASLREQAAADPVETVHAKPR